MFVRYLLYQVPGWILVLVVLALLRDAVDLSAGAAAVLFAAWFVKDLALFPFLRGAYEHAPGPVIERLIGERGRSVEALAPGGYVRVRGELWRARARAGEEPIPAGRPVIVTAVLGSNLLEVSGRAAERQAHG